MREYVGVWQNGRDRASRAHGFTLIEILVCLLIIAIVVAITTPVFHYARESARISSAISYMHQIGKAVAMYRSDWGAGGYSSFYEAGLPPWHYVYTESLRLSTSPLVSPCGYRPGLGMDNTRHAADYMWVYLPWAEEPAMRRTLARYQENTVIVYDPWCNPPGTSWSNPYTEKRGIGLLLGGQVINRRGPGGVSP